MHGAQNSEPNGGLQKKSTKYNTIKAPIINIKPITLSQTHTFESPKNILHGWNHNTVFPAYSALPRSNRRRRMHYSLLLFYNHLWSKLVKPVTSQFLANRDPLFWYEPIGAKLDWKSCEKPLIYSCLCKKQYDCDISHIAHQLDQILS